jgi:succinoglycan biosynthesis transport protein ExoP
MSRDTLPHEESVVVKALGIIRRRLTVAVVAFTTILVAAAAFALYLPDLYQAHATVLIERPLGDTLRPGASDNLESRLYAIQSTILSRDRLTELVNRFNLYPELRQKGSFEEVLTQAREDIESKPSGPEQVSGRSKTVTFTLTYTGDDRKTVADVANAVAGFYASYNAQMRAAEAESATNYFATQLESARQRANAAQTKLNTFVAANNTQLPQSAGISSATYARLNDQLTSARSERFRLEQLKIRLEEDLLEDQRNLEAAGSSIAAESAALGFDPSPELKELAEQLAKAKENVANLERKGLLDSHPTMAEAKAQMARLEQDVKAKQAQELAAHKAREAQAKQNAAADPTAKPSTTRPGRGTQRTIADTVAEIERLKKEEQRLQQSMDVMLQRFDGAPAVQQQWTLLPRVRVGEGRIRPGVAPLRRSEAERSGRAQRPGRALHHPRSRHPARRAVGAAPSETADHGAAARPRRGRRRRRRARTVRHVVPQRRRGSRVHLDSGDRDHPANRQGPRRGYGRLALGTVSAVAVIVLVGTLAAYLANGNEELVRLLNRAG